MDKLDVDADRVNASSLLTLVAFIEAVEGAAVAVGVDAELTDDGVGDCGK